MRPEKPITVCNAGFAAGFNTAILNYLIQNPDILQRYRRPPETETVDPVVFLIPEDSISEERYQCPEPPPLGSDGDAEKDVIVIPKDMGDEEALRLIAGLRPDQAFTFELDDKPEFSKEDFGVSDPDKIPKIDCNTIIRIEDIDLFPIQDFLTK